VFSGARLAAASVHSLQTLYRDEWSCEDDTLKQYLKSARAYRVQGHTEHEAGRYDEDDPDRVEYRGLHGASSALNLVTRYT
jgi:hypothetical protein